MRLFSNDMRVANTAAPSFQSQANVGQYGWTGADQGHYNQLVQYVDECRKIWINLEERINYVEELINKVGDVDAQVQYINQAYSDISKWRGEVVGIRDQMNGMYDQIVPLYNQFNIDYADFSGKYTDVVKMHGETEQAAIAAAHSENNAVKAAEEAKELAEELRKGNVYRGTWNPHTNAYPDNQGTNSTWDVILNEGELEYRWNGILWFWGDRLVYLKDANEYQQIESGGSVSSVNGKTGAVQLGYADVGAAPEGFGLGTAAPVLGTGSCNDAQDTGWYGVNAATTNTPTGSGPSGSSLHVIKWGNGAVHQTFYNYTSDRMFIRRLYTGEWKPWVEVYHTGKKPTPSEIGALSKSGDTMEGGLILASGNNARLTVNNNYIMGSNNAIILRDHGNGNVTLSGGANASGGAGQLYLGYNAAQTGTAGFNTSGVRLEVPMSWKGTSTIVNTAGKVPIEAVEGAVKSTGDTMTGPLFWNDSSKYVNSSGDNVYVAAKTGRVYIEGNSTPIARVSGVDYNMYHQGFKPTAGDVGALPLTGGAIAGTLKIANNRGVNGLDLVQTPTSSPNALGVFGFKSDETTREWGSGVYYNNSAHQYAFFGQGDAPWNNGVKVYSDRVETNNRMVVGGAGNVISTRGGAIRSDTDQVMSLDAYYYSFVTSTLDAHLCSNSFWNGTSWNKYDNARPSSHITVKDTGLVHFWSDAGVSDPNMGRGAILSAQNTKFVSASTIFEPASAYGWTMNDDEMLAYVYPGGCELRGILRRSTAVTIGDKTMGSFRHPNCRIPYTICHLDAPTTSAPMGWAYTESILSGSTLKGGGTEQTTGWVMINIRVQFT